jgi:hypothetical protein
MGIQVSIRFWSLYFTDLFLQFFCSFSHLWSLLHLWFLENMPWDFFVPFMEAFNQRQQDLLLMVYRLMDESISTWQPRTTKTGGLPNIMFEQQNSKLLGTC